MALTVMHGLLISSIIYRIRKDGRAIVIRIMAGRIVQMVSTSWASIVLVCVSGVVSMDAMIYNTRELIINTIIRAWSWKCNNSSMMGEVASWRPNWKGCAMGAYRGFTYNLTLTKSCNFY